MLQPKEAPKDAPIIDADNPGKYPDLPEEERGPVERVHRNGQIYFLQDGELFAPFITPGRFSYDAEWAAKLEKLRKERDEKEEWEREKPDK